MTTPTSINVSQPESFLDPIIRVVGIGNCGETMLAHLSAKGIYDITFTAIATVPDDAQIKAMTGDAYLIFIVFNAADIASLYAATMIAKTANGLNVQTIAIVALPPSHASLVGRNTPELSDYVNATIAMELDESCAAQNAFEHTYDRIYRTIHGIATTIINYGEIRDMSDASMLMPDLGIVRMASTKSTGVNRVKTATEQAIAKLSLPTMGMKANDGLLINITSPIPLKIREITDVLNQFPPDIQKPMVMASTVALSDELHLTLYATRLLSGLGLIRKDGLAATYIYSLGCGVPFVNFSHEGNTLCLYETIWQRLLKGGAHLESISYGKQLLSYLGMTKKERQLLWRLSNAEMLALVFNLPKEAALIPAYFNEIRRLLPKLQPHRRTEGKAVGATITLHMAYIIYLVAHLRHAKNAGGENMEKDSLVKILTQLDTGMPFRILHSESMNAPLPEAETVSIHLVLQLLELYLDEYIVRSKDQAIAWSVERGHLDNYRDTAMGDFGQSLALVA